LLASDILYEETMTEVIVAAENSLARLDRGFEALEKGAKRKLTEDRLPPSRQRLKRYVEARYLGQGYELKVPFPSGKVTMISLRKMVKAFHRAHQRQYLRAFDKPVEIVNIRVVGIGTMPRPSWKRIPTGSLRVAEDALKQKADILLQARGVAERVPTPRYDRDQLKANNRVFGPAIVEQIDSTTLIPPSMVATVDRYGSLLIRGAKGGT
jgi:N-methylhydantoinase A/oxoprolinase/acetone carboxylase beta subunit